MTWSGRGLEPDASRMKRTAASGEYFLARGRSGWRVALGVGLLACLSVANRAVAADAVGYIFISVSPADSVKLKRVSGRFEAPTAQAYLYSDDQLCPTAPVGMVMVRPVDSGDSIQLRVSSECETVKQLAMRSAGNSSAPVGERIKQALKVVYGSEGRHMGGSVTAYIRRGGTTANSTFCGEAQDVEWLVIGGVEGIVLPVQGDIKARLSAEGGGKELEVVSRNELLTLPALESSSGRFHLTFSVGVPTRECRLKLRVAGPDMKPDIALEDVDVAEFEGKPERRRAAYASWLVFAHGPQWDLEALRHVVGDRASGGESEQVWQRLSNPEELCSISPDTALCRSK